MSLESMLRSCLVNTVQTVCPPGVWTQVMPANSRRIQLYLFLLWYDTTSDGTYLIIPSYSKPTITIPDNSTEVITGEDYFSFVWPLDGMLPMMAYWLYNTSTVGNTTIVFTEVLLQQDPCECVKPNMANLTPIDWTADIPGSQAANQATPTGNGDYPIPTQANGGGIPIATPMPPKPNGPSLSDLMSYMGTQSPQFNPYLIQDED